MHQLAIIYKGWSEKEEVEITLSFSLLNVQQQHQIVAYLQ